MTVNRKIPSVSDTFLFLHVFLFAAAVPHLMRLKLPYLAGVLKPRGEPQLADPERITKIDSYIERAIKWGSPFVRPGCLTLGLTRYYFFRRSEVDVSLHFGMGRIGGEFVGHCWLTKGGEPYREKQDPRGLYVEMYSISRENIRTAGQTKAMGQRQWTNP